MPTIDVLTDPGEVTRADGELTLMHPKRDRGEGRSPSVVDVRLRFMVTTDDVPLLCKLYPFAAAVMEHGSEWEGKCITQPKRTVKLRLEDLQGVEVIAGDATLRSSRLDADGLSRWLELTMRVSVPDEYEAPVHALRTVVHAEAIGRRQDEPKPKGKARGRKGEDPAQLELFGHAFVRTAIPQAVPELIIPDVGQIAELRYGRESTWAEVVEVRGEGGEAVLVLRDLEDARKREEVSAKRCARAVVVQADPKLLLRFRSKAKKAGHGRPPSWRWLMEAHQVQGSKDGQALVIDEDVVDRALEAMAREAEALERHLELTHGLPPEDAEATSSARGGAAWSEDLPAEA